MGASPKRLGQKQQIQKQAIAQQNTYKHAQQAILYALLGNSYKHHE